MSRRDQEDRETGQTVSQKNLILAENAQGTEQRAALDNCLPNVWQQLAKARGWCFDFQMCSIYIHAMEYSAAMEKKEIM